MSRLPVVLSSAFAVLACATEPKPLPAHLDPSSPCGCSVRAAKGVGACSFGHEECRRNARLFVPDASRSVLRAAGPVPKVRHEPGLGKAFSN